MAELSVEQAMQMGRRQHQLGQLALAEGWYRRVLAQQPQHAAALHLLGVIAHQAGRNDLAGELIGRAVASDPKYREAWRDLGHVLQAGGKFDGATAAFRQAAALKPDDAEGYNDLGNALHSQGELEGACAAYREAIALRPGYAGAYSNLGNALQAQGRFEAAAGACREAIALQPDFAEAHGNLGNALQGQGQLEGAIAAYVRSIALNPKLPEVHNNLGKALHSKGQLDGAIAAHRRALALRPNYAGAYGDLGHALHAKGELDEAIKAYRQALALAPDNAEIHSKLVCTLHFHPEYGREALAEEHRRWNQRHAEPLTRGMQPPRNERAPERRLRIGYVSPDFSGHPVGLFMRPLLAHHDKSRFEVLGYAQVAAPDAITERLRSYADGWRNLVGLSDGAAAELIRADGIDILVDLAMHTANNRLLVFARKPAPVQVTYLAYCSSTGMAAMDYRLSDPYLDPPGGDESAYSERTIRLPETYWCYEPLIAAPGASPLPALARGHITFGCLNNFWKVGAAALGAWARLLRGVADAHLLLHAQEGTHRQRVWERLEGEGIDRRRVEFIGRAPAGEYFGQYRRIDIALDPFPYGGGTTTCDALWMGVPVVSLVGRTAVGRGGLSILTNVGVPELAARTEEEYVRIAGELAGDWRRLGELRAGLRQRMEGSPLMDGPRFARHVEAAYRQMWRTWCGAGQEAG